MDKQTQKTQWLKMATALRVLVMDMIEKANSGHPGMPLGMADVATVLYAKFLKFDPQNPCWPDRDRFILSAGHGSALLYALLYLTGYKGMNLQDLKAFRQLDSHTAGHPEVNRDLGIETTTGPLAQGLGNAVGMALAEHALQGEFGEALVNHRTYVMAGDGCLMEGLSHEAVSLAGHLKLSKLVILFDDNEISIDGKTSLSVSDDQLQRFQASGWSTQRIDGHDFEAIDRALESVQQKPGPHLIACRTTIGYGAPTKAGSAGIHGSPLGAAEISQAKTILQWLSPDFELPVESQHLWQQIGQRGHDDFLQWTQRHASSPLKQTFDQRLVGDLGESWRPLLQQYRDDLLETKPSLATRTASGQVLEILGKQVPSLIGGSADLTPSNNTKTSYMTAYGPDTPQGRYIHYGVREHGMAAAMNGLALYGGFIPYGGTFLAFSDYCRPAIRLSALMSQQVIYVMTHDSIGLGEDGPTHQPVEHLAALRAIPHLRVFRPCDAMEVAECWALALEARDQPSLLALSRQTLPFLRLQPSKENLSARGGYILKEAQGPREVTLLATGSEVHLCLEAQSLLEQQGISTGVVSMPCFSLFDQQDKVYRQHVLGSTPVRVACEAAVSQGWDKYLGEQGTFVGMTGFGASAPCQDLYDHFNITTAEIVRQVLTLRSRSLSE